ncbi:MAG: hypothetical protein WA581_18620 [Candidatus Acidiferrales bacterium]
MAIAAIVAAICASGCSKANPPAASAIVSDGAATSAGGAASSADVDGIRAAIEEHVRNDRSVNMDMLAMSIDSVSVNGNQAHAEAAFRPKQGGTGMAMTYLLKRQGNGWVVTSGQPSDEQFAHPPTDGVHSGMPANPDEPAIPDLTDFLRNKTSDSKN